MNLTNKQKRKLVQDARDWQRDAIIQHAEMECSNIVGLPLANYFIVLFNEETKSLIDQLNLTD